MSVQFGRWNFEGQPCDPDFLRRAAKLTATFASDGEVLSLRGPVAMLSQAFHTTKESSKARQPLESSSGVMLTWDGRLDNRGELMRLLRLTDQSQADAEIVLASYEAWGGKCFGMILGDWALSIWDPTKQALVLAKDFLGTRQLFYAIEQTHVTWSTVLNPLILLATRSLHISEEFIAGYLLTYPATHLTPYAEISSVPAAKFVRIERGRATTQEYWHFNPSTRLRYSRDAEYEEHFRTVFAESVRRRLRSSSAVLAELSGGMDSTSIVCVADALLNQGKAETPRMDTISYYDDHEPNWNERPYFSLVEKRRGRQGHHIDVGTTHGALLPPSDELFFPFPGYDRMTVERSREISRCIGKSQSRVLLSGIGGDEFLGGLPTPIPELQDLFARGHWLRFMGQLFRFSLQQRRPWPHLCFNTLEEFLPQPIRRLYKVPRASPWLVRSFLDRNAGTLWAESQRTRLVGVLPSIQAAFQTLDHLRRQLNCSHLSEIFNARVTYPYCDRDLLIFLFSIPRQQLVRPGQRRSLMRRALADVVPREILDRKRKAFIARHPLALVSGAMSAITPLVADSLVAAHHWVDPASFSAALHTTRHGELQHAISITRTLKLELWLRSLVGQRLVAPDSLKSVCRAGVRNEIRATLNSRC